MGPVGGGPGLTHGGPMGLREARELVPVVLGWLRRPDPEAFLGDLAAMPPSRHAALRHLLTNQGLAPLVADAVAEGSGAGGAPADASGGDPHGAQWAATDTVRWLAVQLDQNRARMAAFAADLAAVLAGAAAAGIPVVPLKGGLLAFTRYREPALRPMADIDLLVRPADEPGLHAVLERLGYGLVDPADTRHRSFSRPGEGVAAHDGTHPGNPREVEVHTRLLRSVWLDRGGVDLAPYLWAAAEEGRLLGQPAMVPTDAALVTDLASHATLHLMRGSGMLLHWRDVAHVATGVGELDEAFAAWAYPALALAARALPGGGLPAKVERLAPAAGAGLAALAARVPLDDRAGLNLQGVQASSLPWLRSRWRRWRPNPWLVRLANPGLPAPAAYPVYLGRVGARAARKAARAVLGGGR